MLEELCEKLFQCIISNSTNSKDNKGLNLNVNI